MDLIPFRAAVDAGVDGMMTAHVSYPALDPSGSPATLSPPILHDLLRREMGFDGLVVTDALIMEGFIEGIDEASAAVIALQAGCDALLYPEDTAAVRAEVEAALRDGRLTAARVEQALTRIDRAARRMASAPGGRWGLDEDRRWSLETAVRSLQVVRGDPTIPRGPLRIIEIEDDLGGPFPPYPRVALPAALRAAGVELSEQGSPLVALYSDIRAWKGRPGLSIAARDRVSEITDEYPDVTVILFSHPRLEHEIPGARNLLAAWGGEALMQEAVAAKLTGQSGQLPTAASGLDRWDRSGGTRSGFRRLAPPGHFPGGRRARPRRQRRRRGRGRRERPAPSVVAVGEGDRHAEGEVAGDGGAVGGGRVRQGCEAGGELQLRVEPLQER
jgi:hypothetical protein